MAEEEHSGVQGGLEGEKQGKKPEINGEAEAPEYRANPLL